MDSSNDASEVPLVKNYHEVDLEKLQQVRADTPRHCHQYRSTPSSGYCKSVPPYSIIIIIIIGLLQVGTALFHHDSLPLHPVITIIMIHYHCTPSSPSSSLPS